MKECIVCLIIHPGPLIWLIFQDLRLDICIQSPNYPNQIQSCLFSLKQKCDSFFFLVVRISLLHGLPSLPDRWLLRAFKSSWHYISEQHQVQFHSETSSVSNFLATLGLVSLLPASHPSPSGLTFSSALSQFCFLAQFFYQFSGHKSQRGCGEEGAKLHPDSYIGSRAWLIYDQGPLDTALKFRDS